MIIVVLIIAIVVTVAMIVDLRCDNNVKKYRRLCVEFRDCRDPIEVLSIHNSIVDVIRNASDSERLEMDKFHAEFWR